ncbi:MAG: hypothetical protein H6816_08570 [Phycisphaerales bacterium]|nr:hypothetical protein [Phycisphaerales bacterium]
MNVMVDQNGAVYDIYYPSAGCVHGMGTKNEGYVDGLDTFPPLLPAGARDQMNLSRAFSGIRINGDLLAADQQGARRVQPTSRRRTCRR